MPSEVGCSGPGPLSEAILSYTNRYNADPTWCSSSMDATLFDRAEDDEVLTALVAALTHAWDIGCPVAGQSAEQRREMAVVALG